MIEYVELKADSELNTVASVYEQTFHGRFVCEEPGTGLVYLDANGAAYVPPAHYTKEKLIMDLRGGQDFLTTVWTNIDEQVTDPDILF